MQLRPPGFSARSPSSFSSGWHQQSSPKRTTPCESSPSACVPQSLSTASTSSSDSQDNCHWPKGAFSESVHTEYVCSRPTMTGRSGLHFLSPSSAPLSSATCADLSPCEPRTSTLPYSPCPSVSSSSWSSVVGNP